MGRRFLLDVMLGKLATYLRMCGYDTAYAGEAGLEADDAIHERATTADRTLITRDRDLAACTDDAILLESRAVEEQLAALQAAGVEIALPTEPERCSVCNGRIEDVDADDYPEHAPDTVDDVWQCRDCDQYFWKGSHWDRVRETISEISA